jgi:sigma-B regulation protein RsbU (phosphoserine phosphatase)
MRRIVVATVALLTVAPYVVGARAQHVPPPMTEIAAPGPNAVWPHGAMDRFTLQTGDILTLVSDGLNEATKSDTGELFGFVRTRALSSLPALEIAHTARTFGQTDDITVLTVTRLAELPA